MTTTLAWVGSKPWIHKEGDDWVLELQSTHLWADEYGSVLDAAQRSTLRFLHWHEAVEAALLYSDVTR